MFFASSLIYGTLSFREKRILASVFLEDGRNVIAYCPNFSENEGLFQKNAKVYLSHNPNPKRRAKYILELIESSGSLVSINTAHNIPLLKEAIESNKIKELNGYQNISWKIDAPILGFSGIDLLLSSNTQKPNCYVAVNNIFAKQKADAVFPDSVIVSDQRQLLELANIASEGNRAVLLLLVRRMDCLNARMIWHLDPLYSGILADIIHKGVEIACYSCSISLKGIVIDKPIPLFI